MKNLKPRMLAVLAACLLASQPALAVKKGGGGGSGGDLYGAIAYDEADGSYGLTYNYDSRKSAEKDALSECDSKGCEVVVWFKNACGAVAENDKFIGWGIGDSRKEAEREAVKACGKRCEIVAWACTDR